MMCDYAPRTSLRESVESPTLAPNPPEGISVTAAATTPENWPALAESLWAFLTGRQAMISYHFEDMLIEVPRDTASDSPRATWRLHGTLRVSTSEKTH